MTPKETPIRKSFLGFVKKADCPNCGALLSAVVTGSPELCPACGDYAVFGQETLRAVDGDSVAPGHVYAAPTPWPDMQCPTFGALTHPVAQLADMLRTRKEGVRELPAKWPEGCCVCGKPATRVETVSATVQFAPPSGLTRAQKEAVVVAQGVPHCAEHQGGVRFDSVPSVGDGVSVLGLFFRSYGYQSRFRKANPWKW